MKYNQFGGTGLFVSEICLGAMIFGAMIFGVMTFGGNAAPAGAVRVQDIVSRRR